MLIIIVIIIIIIKCFQKKFLGKKPNTIPASICEDTEKAIECILQ